VRKYSKVIKMQWFYFTNLLGNTLKSYIKFLFSLGIFAQSLFYLEKGLNLCHEISSKIKAAEFHFILSLLLQSSGKYKLAIEQCLASIILNQEIIDSFPSNFDEKENDYKKDELMQIMTKLCFAYQKLASYFLQLHNHSKAFLYFEIAKNLYQNIKTTLNNGIEINYDFLNEMPDDYTKLKFISKIENEHSEHIDKLSSYFHNKYLQEIRSKLETKISITEANVDA
jgi:tetratricopeptide (TPR) repeat protein